MYYAAPAAKVRWERLHGVRSYGGHLRPVVGGFYGGHDIPSNGGTCLEKKSAAFFDGELGAVRSEPSAEFCSKIWH